MSDTDSVALPPRLVDEKSLRSPVLWGLFCACSWTWCIGMYLPVILIKRFGWPGFIAFAIANVLGCSALAFFVRTRAQSEAMIAKHRSMVIGFSLLTAAYHAFFVVWLLDELLPALPLNWWAPHAVACAMCALALVCSFFNDRDWLIGSIVVYALSLCTIAGVGFGALDRVAWEGLVAPARLWWLVPTLCFGFFLCPALDLTFHRAIQRSARPRVSFIIFGITFAAMLALTVLIWYSPEFGYRRLVIALILGHLFAQMIFTVGAHLREVRVHSTGDRAERGTLMLLPLLGAGALPIARLFVDSDDAGEWTYLMFLGAYGLLFPAYALLAIVSRKPLRGKRDWLLFVAFVAASAWPYALGFFDNRTHLLALPLLVAIAWGLVRRLTARRAPGDNPVP